LLLYYITDGSQFTGTNGEPRRRLLERVSAAAAAGVDYVQLREKGLSPRDLEPLAKQALRLIRRSRTGTRLLINSRTDVALAAGADGVHLRSNDISPVEVRNIWKFAADGREPVIGVSCHTEAEVVSAANAGADFVVFGPVFGKTGSANPPPAIAQLGQVCRHQIRVLALGGVTTENAGACLAAGAHGIAGIRLFQTGDLEATVGELRRLRGART
jgi:thiamine-phosphate pyrophosphorylase